MPTKQATETQRTKIAIIGPNRYYLIGVRSGSQGDRILNKLTGGLCDDTIDGLTDLETVTAPTLPYALLKMAYVCGHIEELFGHLKALFEHKKSA